MAHILWLYFRREVYRLISVFKGMAITTKYLLFRSPITEKYPYTKNRAGELPARFRGQMALITERRTDGEPDCIACKMCEKVCPNRSLVVEMAPQKHAQDGKTMAKVFDWNYSTCIFCNLCVEACNFDALTFVTSFEGAQQNREDLLWDKLTLRDNYFKSKELQHKRSYDEYMEQRKAMNATGNPQMLSRKKPLVAKATMAAAVPGSAPATVPSMASSTSPAAASTTPATLPAAAPQAPAASSASLAAPSATPSTAPASSSPSPTQGGGQ